MLGKWVRVRIIIVGLGLGLFFVAVFLRLLDLKFIQGPELERKALLAYQKLCPVLPVRGLILDRNGSELAVSTFVKSLGAHPRRLEDKEALSRRLAPLIGMPAAKIKEKLDSDKPFVWIKRHLTPKQAEAVEQFKAEQEKKERSQKAARDGGCIQALEAVYLIPEAKRYYPHQTLAAPVLGFCDIDGRGLEGLERQLDEFIYGKPKQCLNILDARGNIVITQEKDLGPETAGDNVILTIDRSVQYILEKELQKGVAKWQASGGLGMVAVPKTGEILAMAQVPTFDPNRYWDYKKEQYQNRNVTVALEPGSTFKIFTVAAALDAKVVRPTDRYHCENGAFSLGASGVIHDVHPYGTLTVSDIIKKSSNIGAAKIGMRLGPQRLEYYLKSFGFGQRTGIAYAGENFGLVRNITSNRSLIDRVTVAFGQGITTTTLQLTMALSALANDGILMQPLIIKEIVDHQGQKVKEFQPTPVRQVVSPQTAHQMLAMMKTVTEPGGTGTEAVPPGFTVAGKTGTAQKVVGRSFSKSKYNSLFIGVIPAENPVLTIVIVIDEPKGAIYGGVVAAPIFREVAAQTLRYLGYYPRELPAPAKPNGPGEKMPQPVPEIQKPGALEANLVSLPPTSPGKPQMPDLKGQTLRQVLTFVQQAKVKYRLEGRGRVVEQQPEPGQPLDQKTIIYVKLSPRS